MRPESLSSSAPADLLFLFRQYFRWIHHIVHRIYLITDPLLILWRQSAKRLYNFIHEICLDIFRITDASLIIFASRVPFIGHWAFGGVTAQPTGLLLETARVPPHLVRFHVEDGARLYLGQMLPRFLMA